jgi:predicted HD phosphohydrolase
MFMPTVDDIIDLYRNDGARQYGREAVNQLEHALQCAHLAERADAAPELIAACLLHDIGHLIGHRPGWNPAGRAVEYFAAGNSHEYQHTQVEQAALLENKSLNDLHEHRAQWYLNGVFGPGVLEPIRLHVEAKRYLCHAEPAYWNDLSAESKHSLEVQGGQHSGEQAADFMSLPHARHAVLLRRWDDRAKTPWMPTPDLEHYKAILKSVAL